MKKYYQTLNKEKKKEIKEAYKKEYKNSEVNMRLNRLIAYAIIGYLSSIVVFIDAFKEGNSVVWNVILGLILVFVSTIFLVGRYMVKLNLLNKIALKNK